VCVSECVCECACVSSFGQNVARHQIVSIPAGGEQTNALREELARVEAENFRSLQQLRLLEEKGEIRRLRVEIQSEVEPENSCVEEQLLLDEEKEEIRRLRREIEAVERNNKSLQAEIAAKGRKDTRGTVLDGSSSSNPALSSYSGASSASENESEREYEELTVVSPKRKRKRKLAPQPRKKRASKRNSYEELTIVSPKRKRKRKLAPQPRKRRASKRNSYEELTIVSPKRKRKRKLAPLPRKRRAAKRKRDEKSPSDLYEPPLKKLKFGKVNKISFGKGSLALLIAYWDKHVDKPYVRGRAKADLARKAQLKLLQVSNCLTTLFFFFFFWFYGCLYRV